MSQILEQFYSIVFTWIKLLLKWVGWNMLKNFRQWPTWYTFSSFCNTFIIILYTFRALYAHHQEAGLCWCSIWLRVTISDAVSIQFKSVAVRYTGWERILSTCVPDGHWLRVTISDAASIQFKSVATDWEWRYQMLHQYNSTSWWWAYNARNM